jgi:hypothetical protein
MRLTKPFHNIGGFAGGDKYKYAGILFKFAQGMWLILYGFFCLVSVPDTYFIDVTLPDNNNLYGGKEPRDDLAAKSAGSPVSLEYAWPNS